MIFNHTLFQWSRWNETWPKQVTKSFTFTLIRSSIVSCGCETATPLIFSGMKSPGSYGKLGLFLPDRTPQTKVK
jgi:hypothetical protein